MRKNAFLINAHQPYPFSEGRLNSSLFERAEQILGSQGYAIRTKRTAEKYDVEQEIANHQWANIIIVEMPLNWMGAPWSFKKYMDEVYSAGMSGQLCSGDGRSHEEPTKNYGAGGTLSGTKYMFSLTFNAPKEAFDDASEYLCQGRSVDDLMFPMHMNFRFFAMDALPTFACFDVMKNPGIQRDFDRFEAHLLANI